MNRFILHVKCFILGIFFCSPRESISLFWMDGCNSLFFGSLMEKKFSSNGTTHSTYEQFSPFFFEIQWMMQVAVAWTAEMVQALTVHSIPSTYRRVSKVYHGPSTFLHNDIDGTLMRYQSKFSKRESLNWFKKLQVSQFILKENPSKVRAEG